MGARVGTSVKGMSSRAWVGGLSVQFRGKELKGVGVTVTSPGRGDDTEAWMPELGYVYDATAILGSREARRLGRALLRWADKNDARLKSTQPGDSK